MELIRLREVLKRMDTGEEFSLAFVTCDRTRKKAGELIEIDKAVKNTHKHQSKTPGSSKPAALKAISDPNHFQHSTRNIRILSSGAIRKVSIYLIVRYNGKKVHW